jgi:hypothetical protein
MAKLRVTIIDEVRDRRLKVDLPDDAAMEKLLPALAKKLGLPPADYRLTHEATGRALGGDQTLASFGVGEGDALRLAAAREEVPVAPWLAEEEAVPLWQRVPVWGWGAIVGVVLLVAVAGAYLAGRGAKPVPTPTVVVKATTPAATSAAMPRPTATPVAPTDTPMPPTDTPVPTSTPRPTATPVPPTNTPVPTATPQPTPTMDADPTVYDNFNNPANEGSYNKGLWELGGEGQTGQVAQQNGILIVARESEGYTRLYARKYQDIILDAPTLFEARLMLSPDKFDGDVLLQFRANLPGGGVWFSNCEIHGYYGAGCYDYKQEGHWYDAGSKQPVDLGTWHTFRIEVDPATMTFTYYIDGQMVGSHVPVDAEKLKKARFTLFVNVYGKEITGYIDDVRVGPVQ